jgi:hypothetical protein
MGREGKNEVEVILKEMKEVMEMKNINGIENKRKENEKKLNLKNINLKE